MTEQQVLAERLLDIALYKLEWVKAAGGKHYICPLCGAVDERSGGPGHSENCERFEIIKQFDALYPPEAKGMTPEQKAAIRARLEALAIEYHHVQEGEYGCNGLTCPGVQRLVAFATAAVHAAEQDWRAALDQCEQERDELKTVAYLIQEQLTEARRLIAKLHTLVDELNNAAARYKAHWEEARGKAMLEVAFELKALLAEFPMEEKK